MFTGIGRTYDRVATVLSFGQDPRWRRALVASVDAKPGQLVLDVATGTGLVARALRERYACRVVGLDQSSDMLAAARDRDGLFAGFVRARAERLPFPDASFDHVTFTYLLRYVDDPAATLRELARVLRPGGRLATLEFGVPRGPAYPLWWLYTRVGLPLAGRVVSARWREVGAFLGPSIEAFYRRHPQERIDRYWRDAGLTDIRVRRMSLGGGTVMSATRASRFSSSMDGSPLGAAFYALRPGGWRDYWTLLHPPYTLWLLSNALLGAAVAPAPDPRIVAGGLLAFGLAVGVAAHSFDELHGRPLSTRIPSGVLAALGALALAVAVALGIAALPLVGAGLLAFVVVGAVLVIGYAFEAPLIHSDLGFALAWGAFPALTLAYATGAGALPAAAVAGGAAFLSLAQRRLSTRVRGIRRKATSVAGEIRYRDGSRETIDARSLIAAPEAGLRLLWPAIALLAVGVLLSRWL
ncbi:MAG TPA: class I SAM-dependent methyltransferase [Candidatus Limnocylindria bacterium]|nr:class I SAM-dependent methyltransferase [Candidatus Limnocylindria bacterium]